MITIFLKYWYVVFVSSCIGLSLGFGLFVAKPYKYEAAAQIYPAKIVLDHKTSITGVDFEGVDQLLHRVRQPTIYTNHELKACGIDAYKNPRSKLFDVVKLSKGKGQNSIIELKVILESRDLAVSCSQAIFEKIRKSQNEYFQPYLQNLKFLLKENQNRTIKVESLLSDSSQNNSSSSLIYFLNRDKLAFLISEASRLEYLTSFRGWHEAQLVAPIYASELPLEPNLMPHLWTGLFFGAAAGFILALMISIRFNNAKRF